MIKTKGFHNYILVLFTIILIYGCSTNSTPVYKLNADVSPAEAGTVSPATAQADEGEQLQITASANEHWVFSGWQGDHTGTSNPASILMDRDKSVTAMFEKRDYPLSVTVNHEDGGYVEERLVNSKTTDYPHESVVELTAIANDGWEFTGWSGDLSGAENPQTVTVTGPVNVTANFEQLVVVTVEGNGTVEIEFLDSASKTASTSSNADRRARITAIPEEDWVFAAWDGDISESENPAIITFQDKIDVQAIFVPENAAWIVQTQIEGNNRNLRTMYFTDEMNGWIFGNEGRFLRTADGGENWAELNIGIDGLAYGVHFTDANTGWVAFRDYRESPNPGIVLHTNNGGETWTEQLTLDGFPRSLFFTDQDNGWVGGAGKVLRTTDGGSNWQTVQIGTNNTVSSIVFADNNTGWAATFGGPSFRTTDGGLTWMEMDVTGSNLVSISFSDSMNGWGIGVFDGNLFHSIDGGISWNLIHTFQFHPNGIQFINSQIGWAVGAFGSIYRTLDGGNNWQLQDIGGWPEPGSGFRDQFLFMDSVFFIDSQTGWTATSQGHVLKQVSD